MAKEELDFINARVFDAQAEIEKRAERLKQISLRPGAKSAAFKEGARLLMGMIEGQSKLLDVAVFDVPKNALEQTRNLSLLTGGQNKSPVEGIKYATDAMDSMLDALDAMSKQR